MLREAYYLELPSVLSKNRNNIQVRVYITMHITICSMVLPAVLYKIK